MGNLTRDNAISHNRDVQLALRHGRKYLGDLFPRIPEETHIPDNPRTAVPASRRRVECSESTFGYGMTKSSAGSSLAHQTAKM